jgi:hypothetical protein
MGNFNLERVVLSEIFCGDCLCMQRQKNGEKQKIKFKLQAD